MCPRPGHADEQQAPLFGRVRARPGRRSPAVGRALAVGLASRPLASAGPRRRPGPRLRPGSRRGLAFRCSAWLPPLSSAWLRPSAGRVRAPGSHRGSRPRSHPARNTALNSSPLAACSVSKVIASARGSRASASAPSAISVRNRSRSAPQRRASGVSTSPAARTSTASARPVLLRPASLRTAAASRSATAAPCPASPAGLARHISCTISGTAARRCSKSCERFWNGSPARVSAWPSGPA